MRRVVAQSIDAGFLFLDAVVAVTGSALVFYSEPLSRRYNGWTTRLRQRFPAINPPPTPKMAQLNYKVMVVLFSVFGGFMVGWAIWTAYMILYES
jgi:hypothetical protein